MKPAASITIGSPAKPLVRNGSAAPIFFERLNFTNGINLSSSGGSGLGGAMANSGGGEIVAIDCSFIGNQANFGGAPDIQ